jgi:hypothetical protein
MTQLQQLHKIVLKEISQKEWMMEQESKGQRTTHYYAGALAALRYIKHVIDRLIKDDSCRKN